MEKSANAAPTPQQPQPPKKFIKSSASIAATNASSGGVRDEHVVAVIAAAATATAPVENARRRKELSKQVKNDLHIFNVFTIFYGRGIIRRQNSMHQLLGV